VAEARYYQPRQHGAEAELVARWERLRGLVRGEPGDESASPGPAAPR
jgi:hypothetical protein